MAHISRDKLRKEIQGILKGADLSVLSAKKVRLQLEKKLGCELLSRKEEIDTLTMRFVNEQDDIDDESGKSSDSESLESEPEKKKPNRKRAAAPSPPRRSRKDKAKIAKKDAGGSTTKAKGKGNGFTRAYTLSNELATLMGAEALPRHEVVKKMWAMIKERNLYDPKNKQYAICDDDLMKVMGVKRFRTFGMLKYLKTHFID